MVNQSDIPDDVELKTITEEEEREGHELALALIAVINAGRNGATVRIVAISEVTVQFALNQPHPMLALEDIQRIEREVMADLLQAIGEGRASRVSQRKTSTH